MYLPFIPIGADAEDFSLPNRTRLESGTIIFRTKLAREKEGFIYDAS
jgi:hypothetical protein